MDKCYPSNSSFKFMTQQTRLAANLSIVVYTLYVVVVASGYILYRKKIKKTKETLQATFNADGQMPMSLLASTIVSQWTWATNLLGSATAGVQV